ncbi:MAG: acyltransferase family protein [Pseudomonadota bacterium]
MNYRKDIDGLRAFAVIPVIAFHSGIDFFSGGYVGVDVFFVISGYLITTLIYQEIRENRFTFMNFYRRRAARLLPALGITLLTVLIFGFIFYNNKVFDNLGKELFFSSFGAANILFAQGVNYFANDVAYQPLIHLWSLGVEEQFYIIWPIILLLTLKLSKNLTLCVVIVAFLISLSLSVYSVNKNLTEGYFLLHFRAFELLIGVLISLLLLHYKIAAVSDSIKRKLSLLGFVLILIPIFIYDENTNFPGYKALIPCIGSALIIAFPSDGFITKILSQKIFVFFGLISYPLYLFHQPLISFISFFDVKISALQLFFVVFIVCVTFSWLVYKYIECPIRKMVNKTNGKKSFLVLSGLVCTIPVFAIIGLFIAKNNGLESRFKYLNSFAAEVSEAHSTTFHKNFKRGYDVSPYQESSILFFGDSVLQHYVLPIKKALGADFKEIDTVTRGGCVLLKDVDFVEKYSDISCNKIREKLYENKKKYKFIFLSQAWTSYKDSVLNFSSDADDYYKWQKHLDITIKHFLNFADRIFIIAAHPRVDGTMSLQPSIMISKKSFLYNLNKIQIKNMNELIESRDFFMQYKKYERVSVIEPYDIFCNKKCVLKDREWSFFSDEKHLSSASTYYVEKRIYDLIKNNF